MISPNFVRRFVLGAALLVAVPAASFAQFAISISVHTPPPPLVVYAQPPLPAEGYIWTPGYWAYSDEAGYYWVPGVWVQPPTVGVYWTPAWWGFEGGVYGFHPGYWGPHVGYYGGINYGFGYTGIGFGGGMWVGGRFSYNSAVANFGGVHVTNVYVNRTVINTTVVNHASFNGPGGYNARPRPEELQYAHEQHFQPTAQQQQHFETAAHTPEQRFSANGGHPAVIAARSPEAFHQQVAARGAVNNPGTERGGFGNNRPVPAARPEENIARPQPAARPEENVGRPQAQPARPQAQEPRPQPAPHAQAPHPAPRESHPAPKKEEEHPKR
jgi:hypothetical protein